MRWKNFRKALSGKDVTAFDKMVNACWTHTSAAGMAARPVLAEAMFMCILLYQQLELMEIKASLERLEKKFQKT